MSEGKEFTAAEKLAAIKRELRFRERAYPRWVEQGKYTSAKAAHEIAVMQAILLDYQALADAMEAETRLI